MTEKLQDERRSITIPVDHDRRSYEKSRVRNAGSTISERVSVLEIKIDNTNNRLEESYAIQNKVIERLDKHTEQATARDHELQIALVKITSAVTELGTSVTETGETLKTIAGMATSSHNELQKWNTVIYTLIKVASVGAAIAGAAWTVFTYLSK